MADNQNGLRKTKKVPLPPGWVERFSKKHPDRPFYFNELTGESRWSAPLDINDKNAKGTSQKGKKRKVADIVSEESADETTKNAAKLLDAISPKDRPKLKAKGPLAAAAEAKESKNDTPTMRLYREKLAQRKAALEAKKSTPKANKKPNQTVTPSKAVPQASLPTTPKNNRRMTRASSVLSTESESSSASTVVHGSGTDSSIGSKIAKAAAAPLNKSPAKTPAKNQTPVHSTPLQPLPKIPKVQPVKASPPKKRAASPPESSFVSVTSDEDAPATSTARRSIKSKGVANERLAAFRKSLSLEKNKASNKSLRLSNVNNNNVSPPEKSKSLLKPPTPTLYSNAQLRLHSLENRVESSGLLEINISKKARSDDEENAQTKSLLEKVGDTDIYCEQMEWEPIEDEKIMSEVHSVRYQLCEKPAEKLSELARYALQSIEATTERHSLYIIVDTNVFLTNLPFIEEVRDSRSDAFGRPFIVIPWTVLQELDFIKDDKNHTRSHALKLKARKAVDFLNKHFSTKHPRFLGQSPSDVEKNKEKFIIECPDDEILQTCLQVKEMSKTPVLLSYDKNLCNKAMIHDIPTLGRDDPLEKMYYLKAAETRDFLSNSLHNRIEESPGDVSVIQKELLAADDIMEEGKAVLKSVLSEVVAKEMSDLFGERWEMHVIIRPPWSVATVLKCALKHWMAAVSESFQRRTEPMIRDLQVCINNAPNAGRKLQDVKFFLDKCNDVFQTLNANKHPNLKPQALGKIGDLLYRCTSTVDELNNERLQDSVGSAEDAAEMERRAAFAFKIFEDVYAYARDSCGIASDALGLQCSFSYNKMHPYITPKVALHEKQNIGVDVNKLLQVLKMTLSIVDEGIHPNHKAILALYEVLAHFASDPNYEELSKLTPLDLLCCIRLQKQKLEKGCEQLQELAAHFCRMANYQCQKPNTYNT